MREICLERLARRAPKALFLESKGLELCRSVRATCAVPIFLVFDAMPSCREAVEAFDHGCSDILVRPIEKELLQKKLAASELERSQQRQSFLERLGRLFRALKAKEKVGGAGGDDRKAEGWAGGGSGGASVAEVSYEA